MSTRNPLRRLHQRRKTRCAYCDELWNFNRLKWSPELADFLCPRCWRPSR